MSKDDNPPATTAQMAAMQTDIDGLKQAVERLEATNIVLKSSHQETQRAVEGVQDSIRKLSDAMSQFARDTDERLKVLHEDMSAVINVVPNVEKRLDNRIDQQDRRFQKLERHVGLRS